MIEHEKLEHDLMKASEWLDSASDAVRRANAALMEAREDYIAAEKAMLAFYKKENEEYRNMDHEA